MSHQIQRDIAVIGPRQVGKSSLVKRYIDGPTESIEAYHPTIEQTHHKELSFAGRSWKVKIIDTAGQDSSSFFPLKYAVGLHGYVLVYDTTNRTSFDLIQVIHEKMLEAMGAEWVPCVVVGNKSDIENARMVSAAEGKKFAASIKAPFVETSATKNANLNELMNLLLHEIWYTKEGNVAPAATATAASGGSWISSWFGGGKK